MKPLFLSLLTMLCFSACVNNTTSNSETVLSSTDEAVEQASISDGYTISVALMKKDGIQFVRQLTSIYSKLWTNLTMQCCRL